ncbi:metallophosphoesterase [Streptomyces sp. NPDC023838]|uniref:metallophosphoesterase family protein n=1 Tax=Streptomyces sp. NPDC023838 TaxID=3154325 RepID=UPI00340A7544
MSLYAISDLHVGHAENRAIVDGLRPDSSEDWLMVAGDVGEKADDVLRTMEQLAGRFATVVWAPGNHELWTPPADPVQLRGQARYEYLVQRLRDLGVATPEDPYRQWPGPDGPVVVAPLFVLYDYTFRPKGAHTKEEALAVAHGTGVVCMDEYLLHPDPYPSRDAWCRARLAYTRSRLDAVDPALPTVLVNHFPLVREPTRVLRHPEFAQWCGTEATADWHVRYRAAAVVYGHLHIPRAIDADGVPHLEVSLGYPREWGSRSAPPQGLCRILPEPASVIRW